MLDKFKKTLEHDTRLLARNLRNHIISEGQIKELQSKFPDTTTNARWLRSDGTRCHADEENELLRLHKDGWQEILTGKQS